MLRLYAFSTQNSRKALYVIEELGCDYDFRFVNLLEGENRSDWFQRMTPVGKVPVLEHDDRFLFESGAICRYLANLSASDLYPQDIMQRAQVDQWMDFFSCHLGHWLTTLYFERVMKPMAGLGQSDEKSCKEAQKFALRQCASVNGVLEHANYLANDQLSIADLFAFAYLEQHQAIDFPLHSFSALQAWYEHIAARPGIARGHDKLRAYNNLGAD